MNITIEHTDGHTIQITFTGLIAELRNAIDATCNGQWTMARYTVDGVKCAVRNKPPVFTEQTIDGITYTLRG